MDCGALTAISLNIHMKGAENFIVSLQAVNGDEKEGISLGTMGKLTWPQYHEVNQHHRTRVVSTKRRLRG